MAESFKSAMRASALLAEARAFRFAARYALTMRGRSSIYFLSEKVSSRFGRDVVDAFNRRVDSWGKPDCEFAASPDEAWDHNGFAFLFMAAQAEDEARALREARSPKKRRGAP